jgi:hypothetical protein
MQSEKQAFDGVTIEVKLERSLLGGEVVKAIARDGATNEWIGEVEFRYSEFDGSPHWFCPSSSDLEEEYSRRGIGTAMYVNAARFLESNDKNGRIQPSDNLTNLGLVFWDSLRQRYADLFEIPSDFPWRSVQGNTVDEARELLQRYDAEQAN